MSSGALPRERQSLRIKQQYLILYNTLSSVLWAAVLARVLLTIPFDSGFANVYRSVGEFTKWTQSLALLEIIHSLLGTVQTEAPHLVLLFQHPIQKCIANDSFAYALLHNRQAS